MLFIADGESEEGTTELSQAVSAGFADIPALEALLEDAKIPAARKDDIRRIIGEIKTAETARKKKEEAAAAETQKTEETGGDAEDGADGANGANGPEGNKGTTGSTEGENPVV